VHCGLIIVSKNIKRIEKYQKSVWPC